MPEITEVNIQTLGGGSLAELFELEWNRLLHNIQDPNTDAEAKRVLTMKVTVVPDESREKGDIEIDVAAKLPGPRTATDTLYMGMREGRLVGVRYDPRQSDMFRPDSGVTPLPLRKEGDV